jgi:hypothetical protein
MAHAAAQAHRHGRDRLDPDALGEVVEEDVAALGNGLDQVHAAMALALPAMEPAIAQFGVADAVDLSSVSTTPASSAASATIIL